MGSNSAHSLHRSLALRGSAATRCHCGELLATALLAARVAGAMNAVREKGRFAHGRGKTGGAVREKGCFAHGRGKTGGAVREKGRFTHGRGKTGGAVREKGRFAHGRGKSRP